MGIEESSLRCLLLRFSDSLSVASVLHLQCVSPVTDAFTVSPFVQTETNSTHQQNKRFKRITRLCLLQDGDGVKYA